MAITQQQMQTFLANRSAVEAAKAQAQAAEKAARPTQQALRQQAQAGQGIAGYSQRQAVKGQIGKFKQQVAGQENVVETDIAKYAPEIGQEGYVDKVFQKAKADIEPKIEGLKNQLKEIQQQRETIQADGLSGSDYDALERIDLRERIVNDKLGVYEGAVKGNKQDFIRDYYSGNVEAKADYAVDKSNASYDRMIQSRSIREQATTQAITPTQQSSNVEWDAQMAKFQSLGLKPLTKTEGNVTKVIGFEDTKAGMTYGVDNLPAVIQKYRPQDLAKFEAAGLLTMVTLPQQKEIVLPNNLFITPVGTPQRVTMGGQVGSVNFTKQNKYGILDVLSAPVDVVNTFWTGAGNAVTKELGVVGYKNLGTYTSKEVTIPQRVTIGGEFKISEQKIPILPAQEIGGAVKIAGTTGTYIATSSYTIPATVMNVGFIASGARDIKQSTSPLQTAGGVLQIAIGAAGLKTTYANLKAAQEVNLFNQAKTKTIGARIEAERAGFDILVSSKKVTPTSFIDKYILRIKEKQYVSQQVQPFYNVREGTGAVMEGGKIKSAVYNQRGNVEVSYGDVSGTSRKVINPPKMVTKEGIITIGDAEAVVGRLQLKETARVSGKIGKNPLTGQQEFVGAWQEVSLKMKINFGGIAKEGKNGIINVVGGEVKGVNYDIITDVTSARIKPDIFGKIKKIDLTKPKQPTFSVEPTTPAVSETKDIYQLSIDSLKKQQPTTPVIQIAPEVKAVTKIKGLAPVYQKVVAEKSMGLLLPVQKSSTALASSFTLASKLRTKQISVTKTETQQELKEIQLGKLFTKTKDIPILRDTLKTKDTFNFKDITIETQIQPEIIQQEQLQLNVNVPNLQTPTPTITQIPTKKIIIPPFAQTLNRREPINTSFTDKQLFNVLVRRNGNWLQIAKNLPKGKASLTGTKEVTRSLARSFKLEKAGRGDVSDISFRTSSVVFRPTKREQGVMVQRRKYSLSAPSEKSEIQMFKRKSNRNKTRRVKIW